MKGSISKTEKKLLGILSAAVLNINGKIAAVRIGTDIILPAPEDVFFQLLSVLGSADFWLAAGATVLRTFYGLLISFGLGFFLGIVCGLYPRADAFLSPLISTTRTVPVMSIILLAMIWFKTDTVPVFVCILMIFPILTANVKQGVKAVDKNLLELGTVYRFSRKEMLSDIVIPSVIPFVLAGLRSGIGVGWKVVIAAEVLCQPARAIGTGLQFSQMNLETADVMAWTVVAVILSWLSESGLDLLIRHRKWEQYND